APRTGSGCSPAPGPTPTAAATDGSNAPAAAAYPAADGWNWSGPHSAGSEANFGASREPIDTVRPPASTTAIVCAAANRLLHARATWRSGGTIGGTTPRFGEGARSGGGG